MSAMRPARVGIAVLILAVASLWWMLRDSARPTAKANAIASVEVDPAPVAMQPCAPKTEVASDDIRLMAPGSNDNSIEAPRHPHPITPAHERNFRQLNMVSVLNSAMDVGDVEELRRANRIYRAEYPEAKQLQDGYDVIADCLERRTSATRAAGQRYWQNEIASNLRRYVRRHCLEEATN
jgi:hypothetical protein